MSHGYNNEPRVPNHVEITQYRRLLHIREADLARIKENYANLLNYNRKLREAYDVLQREHNGLSHKLESTTNLSNLRGEELASAQVFLNKSDTISAEEVQDRVDALNEEVFQAAASLGDCIVRSTYELSDEDKRLFHKRIGTVVGDKILDILYTQAASSGRDVNPLLVQIVVQIFLVFHCVDEVNDWDPHWSELSKGLDEIYQEMQSSKQPPICRRWRALSMAQIKPKFGLWEKYVLKSFERLLKVARWEVSPADQFAAFKRRLETIFKAMQEVRQAIGQDVISEDYKIHIIPQNTPFSNTFMEEAYGDDKESNRDRVPIVLGTTALGLVKAAASSGQSHHGGEFEYVVPPKVVVDRSFRRIMGGFDNTSSSSSTPSLSHSYSRLDGRD